MNLLFMLRNPHLDEELDDIAESLNCKAYFAKDCSTAVSILNRTEVQVIFIEVLFLDDVVFLKYVEENYPNTNSVLVMTSHMEDIFQTIRETDYDVLNNPIKIEELLPLIDMEGLQDTLH